MSEDPATYLARQTLVLRGLPLYQGNTEFRSLVDGLLEEQEKLLDTKLSWEAFHAISAQVGLYRAALDAWFAKHEGQSVPMIEQ